jgi:hypothetical protein
LNEGSGHILVACSGSRGESSAFSDFSRVKHGRYNKLILEVSRYPVGQLVYLISTISSQCMEGDKWQVEALIHKYGLRNGAS